MPLPAIGAISALRQQGRTDVKVYGQNGNAQAIENIQKGFMTATAWQDTAREGVTLVDVLECYIVSFPGVSSDPSTARPRRPRDSVV